MSSVQPSETQLSSGKNEWRTWSRNDWNNAIFSHFFLDTDGEDRPVYRISVTQAELAKIVGQPDIQNQEIQTAFLNTIRTKTHADFNRRLKTYPLDSRVGWRGSGVPPFFIELAFSCLVSSPPDDEIRKDGDFRRRLALLLGHDGSLAQYPLTELPVLWRAFSLWLDSRRMEGAKYRRLELPPLDHRVRIGYSIQLAFPSRKDHNLLVDTLLKNSLLGGLPIPAIVEAVGKEISRFSDNFMTAYNDFRSAFINNEIDLAKYPFWAAVKEASSTAQGQLSTNGEEKTQLRLVCEPGCVVLLLSTQPREYSGSELAFVKTDTPYGEFSCVLCDGDIARSGFIRATDRLLNGRYRPLSNEAGWSSIDIAIRQGILLFEKTDAMGWELTFVRPNDGEIKGLVRRTLISQFLNSFPPDKRPEAKDSRYVDWIETNHFPASWLQSMKYSENGALSAIRCLQPTAYSPRLALLGGCSVLGGYLGIPYLLPVVRAPMCDAVQVIPDDSSVVSYPIELERIDPGGPDFRFPDSLQWPLEGSFRVVGTRRGRVYIQKNTIFHPEIVVNDYGRPTNLAAWEMEAGGPDILTCGDFSDQARRVNGSDDADSSSVAAHSSPDNIPIHTDVLFSHDEYLENNSVMENHSVWEPSSFAHAIRFMETCGGLAMQRKGIAEQDMIDIVKQCLGVVQHRSIWDTLRAWIEAGYFDRLDYRRWRRTEYYARRPRFSLMLNTDGSVRGTLVGLATSTYRKRADVELLNKGCVRLPVVSLSGLVMPCPAWVAPKMGPFFDVSELLGLEGPSWIEPIPNTLWSLSDVFVHREPPPRFFELSGSWDWEHGWFSSRAMTGQKGLEVLRFSRPDRPSFYQATMDGESVWWSKSRNWILLFAHVLASRPVFSLMNTNQIIRIGKGQIYLPLPVGRHLVQTGATPPGPIGDAEGYRYTFHDKKERQCLLATLLGPHQSDTPDLQRWALWILSLSRRTDMDPSMVRMSVPFDLQRDLAQFRHVPEIREIIRTRFHPYVLYRIRVGMSKFSR